MKNYSIEIKWAIRYTLLSLAWAIGEHYCGLHDVHIQDYGLYSTLFVIPAIVFFVLALREKRTYFFNGTMSWAQGFVSGTILSFIIALLTPMAQLVIYKAIAPHFFENLIAYKVEHHYLKMAEAQKYFNLNSYMLQNTFNALSNGVVLGAIISMFLKPKK
jgi:hypothetical protein